MPTWHLRHLWRSKMRTLASVAKIAFLGISLGVLGWAQAVSTSQINGTVQDASGAVLPGAEITATQTDTGAVRMTISNETGSYVLPNLPVGRYMLEVSLPGFRTFVQSGIILQVNSSPVVNAVLAVGQVSETVEVQANAAMVETRSTGIGQVIENARILELPLVGRQVTDLIPLSGAALPLTTTDTTYRGVYPNTTSFSIAGGLLGGNTYTLFGGYQGTITRSSPQNTTAFVPTADMIAGDFTTFASPVCQGRSVPLGAPFVNNRLPASAISPGAVAIAKRLPPSVDACGRTNFG